MHWLPHIWDFAGKTYVYTKQEHWCNTYVCIPTHVNLTQNLQNVFQKCMFCVSLSFLYYFFNQIWHSFETSGFSSTKLTIVNFPLGLFVESYKNRFITFTNLSSSYIICETRACVPIFWFQPPNTGDSCLLSIREDITPTNYEVRSWGTGRNLKSS